MPVQQVHTCVRVRDIDASSRFYTALGFEERGRLNFDSAYNVYFGLPGDGDRLELTVNVGREEPYDLGEGYNHFAMTVEDLDGLLATLAESLGGVESLIEVPQAMTHQSVEGSAAAVPADLVRLSCGVEDPEDLVADLRAAIA